MRAERVLMGAALETVYWIVVGEGWWVVRWWGVGNILGGGLTWERWGK